MSSSSVADTAATTVADTVASTVADAVATTVAALAGNATEAAATEAPLSTEDELAFIKDNITAMFLVIMAIHVHSKLEIANQKWKQKLTINFYQQLCSTVSLCLRPVV